MILHHLGIACDDIGETLDKVREIFPVTEWSQVVHDPEQNADLCMVSVRGSVPLELIAGPVVRSVVRKGVMLYHTCWEVDDIDETLTAMRRDSGCLVISEPKPAVLFGNRHVAFLTTPVGLVEILEKAEKTPATDRKQNLFGTGAASK